MQFMPVVVLRDQSAAMLVPFLLCLFCCLYLQLPRAYLLIFTFSDKMCFEF